MYDNVFQHFEEVRKGPPEGSLRSKNKSKIVSNFTSPFYQKSHKASTSNGIPDDPKPGPSFLWDSFDIAKMKLVTLGFYYPCFRL